jgi:hypothetical protein
MPSEDASAGDGGARDGGHEDDGHDADTHTDDAGESPDAEMVAPLDAGQDAGDVTGPEDEEPSDAGPQDASLTPDASRDAGKPYTGIPDSGPIVVEPWTFEPDPDADPSFSAVYAYLRGNCRSCHGSSPNGLDLSSSVGAYLSLIGGPAMGESEMYCGKGFYKVIPGDPANSLLFTKMYGKQVCGFNMPPGEDNSRASLSTVWRWIENGALYD